MVYPICSARSVHHYFQLFRYENETSDAPLRILRITSPIIFINCDIIREQIEKQAIAIGGMDTGVNSRSPSMRSQPLITTLQGYPTDRSKNSVIVITHDSEFLQANPPEWPPLRYILLDCSGVAYVDPEAIQMLSRVYTELDDDDFKLLFAGVNARIRDFLETSNFFDVVPRSHFFPTLQEALSSLRNANVPLHTSVSMNGYRDVITLSTAPSNIDISCPSPEPV
ncbi:STAS domain protein [Cooperia oncophora]